MTRTSDTNQLTDPPEAKQRLLYASACFILATIVCLAHQTFCTEPRNIALFDSRNYLETTKLIYQLIHNFVTAPLSNPLDNVNTQYLAKRLIWDGPTLPMVPAIVFSILGKEPSPLLWPVLSGIQSLYHGLTASIIFLLAKDMCKSNKAALLAGLAWSLYPSAIISSGRFLTEGFSALLVIVTIFLMSRLIRDHTSSTSAMFGQCTICGVIQALLFLTKPILAPACIGANILAGAFLKSCAPRTRLLLIFIGIALGASLIIGPWLIVTKELTGKALVSPSRFPLTNLAIGSNWESDGWETFPQSTLHSLYCQNETPRDKELLLPTFLSMVATHPKEITSLCLRKLNRLFLEPWNGCSNSVFGINLDVQRKLHLAIVILGILGLLALASGARIEKSLDLQSSDNPSKIDASIVVGGLCIAFFVGHLIYLPFQAMARYGFTSMPCLFLLSAFFWNWALRTFKTIEIATICFASIAFICIESFDLLPYTVLMTGNIDEAAFLQFALYSVSLILFLLFIRRLFIKYSSKSQLSDLTFFIMTIVVVSAVFANSTYAISSNEWKCDLKPSDIATRRVFIPKHSGQKPIRAFLLIDCNEAINQCDTCINGYTLKSTLEPIFDFSPENFWVYKTMRDCTAMKQIAFQDIRKWRIASIPLEELHLEGDNIISIKSTNSKVRLYGDFESKYTKRRAIPELLSFSPPLLFQNLVRNEGRVRSAVGAKVSNQSCQLLLKGKSPNGQDLSDDPGMQSGEFRMFILIANSDINYDTIQNEITPWEREISVNDFNAYLNPEAYTGVPNPAGKMIQINSKILKLAPSISAVLYPTKEVAERLRSSTRVNVKLTGSVKSNTSFPCRVGPAIFLNGEDSSQVLPALPNFIVANNNWTNFEIMQSIPLAAIPGGLKSVTFALFPGPWEQVSRH